VRVAGDHQGHRSRTGGAYHPAVASDVPSVGAPRSGRGLAGLTPSGRGVVPVAWALYDFANTIFSFAVVSGAIGLFLNDRFGARDGAVLLSISIALSVGLNALVSPILGALSDRGGRRMPFLLLFTALCIGATFFIADVPPLVGLVLFIVANFAYQAALIYYDATLKTVSYPETRGRLSGDRHSDRLLRHDRRRAADLPARRPGGRSLPTGGTSLPDLRDTDLCDRARAAGKR
jgi:hypothetical protein